MIIDTHVHLLPKKLERYPLAAGFKRTDLNFVGTTAEQFLSVMRTHSVSKAVLVQPNFFGYDNSYIEDAIKRHAGTFTGIPVIDQDGGTTYRDILEYKAAGFKGFRIYPKNQPIERWCSSLSMENLWAMAAKHNLVISCLIDPPALPALRYMCHRFPDTMVVIDHIARITTTMLTDTMFELGRFSDNHNEYVKVSAFYALSGKRSPPYGELVPLVRYVYEKLERHVCSGGLIIRSSRNTPTHTGFPSISFEGSTSSMTPQKRPYCGGTRSACSSRSRPEPPEVESRSRAAFVLLSP